MSTLFNKFKFSRSQGRTVRTRELVNPAREWLLGLVLATGMFGVGVLYLGYDFWEQYHMVDNRPVVDETVVRYRQNDTTHYLEEFRKRDIRFQALRADVPAITVSSSTVPLPEEADSIQESAEGEPLAEEPRQQ